jgi:hypothetical protein
MMVRRPAARTAASMILRGPTDAYCDEMERSAHDALCAVRRVLESGRLAPGGGAVEAALSIYLENFATTLVRTLSSSAHSCPHSWMLPSAQPLIITNPHWTRVVGCDPFSLCMIHKEGRCPKRGERGS